jgi:hypothetical protein
MKTQILLVAAMASTAGAFSVSVSAVMVWCAVVEWCTTMMLFKLVDEQSME